MPRPKAEPHKAETPSTVVVRYLKGDAITVFITSEPLTITATGTAVPAVLADVLLSEKDKFAKE